MMNEWDPESRERRREQRSARSRPQKKSRRSPLIPLGLLLALVSATAFVLILTMSVLSEENPEQVGSNPESSATSDAVAGSEDEEATGNAGSTTTEPSTTTSLREVVELPVADVRASSYIEPSEERTYGPDNLIDGDPATAWNEDAEGLGEGEWVRLQFETPIIPARLEVANGYQRDEERFTGNGRIEQMTVKYSDGTSQTVELEDREGFQDVPLPPKETEWLLITAQSVYPGSTWEDLALSEIRVFGSRAQLP